MELFTRRMGNARRESLVSGTSLGGSNYLPPHCIWTSPRTFTTLTKRAFTTLTINCETYTAFVNASEIRPFAC